MKELFTKTTIALLIALSLTACSDAGEVQNDTEETSASAVTAVSEDEQPESEPESGAELFMEESSAVSEQPDSIIPEDESSVSEAEIAYTEDQNSILSSPEDIALTDTDGEGTRYSFTYGDETYYAVYTPDNWKIIDSYKITNRSDMIIICEALRDIYPIHGSDMESFRTAEDMAYEWVQHNIAYTILPPGSPWRDNARDVDINPADQGKSMIEMYQAKTGRELPEELQRLVPKI